MIRVVLVANRIVHCVRRAAPAARRRRRARYSRGSPISGPPLALEAIPSWVLEASLHQPIPRRPLPPPRTRDHTPRAAPLSTQA